MRNEPPGSAPRVLVVEDERALADIYASWLTDQYEVETAYDGETALGRYDEGVDVVLLDRRLPGISHDIVVPVQTDRATDSFQILSRDITPRKERERELERQNERLEDFASVVSHDLRNPLNVAQSSVELVRDDIDNDHVDRIDRSLERMNDIIDDVLLLARQGDTVDDPSPVDLETMVSDAWSYVDIGDVELVVEPAGRIEADPSRLQEVLGNLFRNAAEHGDATSVTVGPLAAERAEDEGDFYVADDGEGIPDSNREEVFETGFSTARGGTGLGLSIVREIANAHGWSVRVTDSASGGARFEITGVTAR
jgi:signal transduction histidine kinase